MSTPQSTPHSRPGVPQRSVSLQSAPKIEESAKQLRERVIDSLKTQGFSLRDGQLIPPDITDKAQLRALHQEAAQHNVERSRSGLERHENRLLSHIASGTDIIPEEIRPRLVLVQPHSEDELLFRYARLHWSIPVSAGYGRRLRFVVYDESNGKLIGIFGLADPIFGLGPRDRWIGWDLEARKRRLQCVMDLFVLGAVPPYSHLLCGKLVALLATSQTVQDAFYDKYGGQHSCIRRNPLDGRIALLTTTSALGRSALYNRLRVEKRTVFQSIGFTSGSGEFHFSNGLYKDLRDFTRENCEATAKHPLWGNGFRNRREIVRKALPLLGLPNKLLYHGVKREIFAAPLAANSTAFLCGNDRDLKRRHLDTADSLFGWFRKRWLLPRAARDKRYRDFNPGDYRLWGAP